MEHYEIKSLTNAADSAVPEVIKAARVSRTSGSDALSFLDEGGHTVATLYPFPGLLIIKKR